MSLRFSHYLLILLASLAAGCGAEMGDDRDNLDRLSEPQQQFARACHSAMARNRIEFSSGASAARSCSCLAEELERYSASPDNSAYYAVVERILGAMIAAEKKKLNEADYVTTVGRAVDKEGAEARQIHKNLISALETCEARAGK